MALVLEKPVVVPDAVFVPMVLIQTGIDNGKLVISCQFHLAAAKCTGRGTPQEFWEATGQSEMIHLSNAQGLDPDLAAIAPQLADVYGRIIAALGAINAIRKVL